MVSSLRNEETITSVLWCGEYQSHIWEWQSLCRSWWLVCITRDAWPSGALDGYTVVLWNYQQKGSWQVFGVRHILRWAGDSFGKCWHGRLILLLVMVNWRGIGQSDKHMNRREKELSGQILYQMCQLLAGAVLRWANVSLFSIGKGVTSTRMCGVRGSWICSLAVSSCPFGLLVVLTKLF